MTIVTFDKRQHQTAIYHLAAQTPEIRLSGPRTRLAGKLHDWRGPDDVGQQGRVLVAVAGTLGDVLPALGVAASLHRRGLRVVVATHEDYFDYVPTGIEKRPLPFSPTSVLSTSDGQLLVSRGIKRLAGIWRVMRHRIEPLLEKLHDAARDVDALVYSGVTLGADHVAEFHNIPAIRLLCHPSGLTTEMKSSLISSERDWGPLGNMLSYMAVEVWTQVMARRPINAFRRQLGMTPISRIGKGALLADGHRERDLLTVAAIPPELATSSMRQRSNWTTTGFVEPTIERGNRSDSVFGLIEEHHRSRDAPVIYLGLGTPGQNIPVHHELARMFIDEAFAHWNALVITQGRVTESANPATVIEAPFIKHSEIFPMCDLIVHHGGAGTTAAALRAAKPMIILPVWFDQFYWSRTCKKFGVAAEVSYWSPNQKSVRAALHQALSTQVADSALSIGNVLTLDDGSYRAAEAIVDAADLDSETRRGWT